jgi:hypothetical protein
MDPGAKLGLVRARLAGQMARERDFRGPVVAGGQSRFMETCKGGVHVPDSSTSPRPASRGAK